MMSSESVKEWLNQPSRYGFESVKKQETLRYIQQLEAQVPKWISAKNPPKDAGEYLVIVQKADGKKERRWDIFHPDRGWCDDVGWIKVLYWMSFDSLPEPPKEE